MHDRTKRRVAGGLIAVVVLTAIYTLAGFLLVPYAGQRMLARYADVLERHLEAAELRFNPYTYTATAREVTLRERDGAPIARIGEAHLDLDFWSVVRDAWRVSDVTLRGIEIDITVDRNGETNLARLARDLRKGSDPAQDQRAPPALTIGNLLLDQLVVRYVDRSRGNPVQLAAGPMLIKASDLSTVQGREGRYAIETALPEKAALKAEGTLGLMPLVSSGSVAVNDLRLSTLWPLVADGLQLSTPRGAATAQARYRFQQKDGQTAFAVEEADLRLEQVQLALPGAERPLLEVERAHAAKASYDSATATAVISTLTLANGRYLAALDADGRFNWAQLATAKPDPKPAAGRPWQARITEIHLDNIAVRYEDHTRLTPLVFDIGRGDARLGLALASGPEGVRTTADGIRLELKAVALEQAGKPEPLARWARAAALGRIDTGERVIRVDDLQLSGGALALLRDAQGSLPLAAAFASRRPPEPPSGPAWATVVGNAAVEDTRLALGDDSYSPALRYDLDISRLAVKNVDAGSTAPLAYELAAKASQGGTLQAAGTASQDFAAAQAKLDVRGLNLAPLQTVLGRYTTLQLTSGQLGTSAAVAYTRAGKPMLRVTGGADVTGLVLHELGRKEPFFVWKRLAADNVVLTLGPDRIDVQEVTLDSPQTAIVIAADRKVNLTQVVRDTKGTKEATAPAPKPAADSPAFPARVGRVRIVNGTLDFADLSLVLPFSTRVVRVNGSMLGVSTDPDSRAELKVAGNIEPSGYASAEGGVNLREPTAFMDINVKFQNVEMPPLSPYTATFAGRKIDGGRLWLDLDYKIVDKQLAGANRVLLENVELGERVQAPNALDLPLDLAIALLKDSQGRINMTIPVSGDVGNPQFAYGALIRDAIGAALARIVTAPFRALASLFGGGSDAELSKVRFSAGSARLFPPERERLLTMVKGLQDRPQLRLVVHGTYDAQRDGQRLRLAPVRQELAQTMGMTLKAGEDPGPIAYSDTQTQQAIEKLFVAREGRDGLRAFAEAFQRGQGESAPRSEADRRRVYYEALFERLVERQPVPDTALEQLAGERARAIAAVLAEAGLAVERTAVGAIRPAASDNPRPGVEAELALTTR